MKDLLLKFVEFRANNFMDEELDTPEKEIDAFIKSLNTASIDIDNVKDSDGWASLGFELGYEYETISKIFQWGEYGSATLIVDKNLNIVGGSINPHQSDWNE